MTYREKNTPASHSLWINESDRILSFAKMNGFGQVDFSSYNQMMDYAIQISRSGYRIQ